MTGHAPPGAPAQIQRVVVGYDRSDSANAAAAFALWMAGKVGCETAVLHAVPTPEDAANGDDRTTAANRVVAYERQWQRRLQTLREYAALDATVTCEVVRGHPAGALIAAAVESRADMILTGSHGVGRVRGGLLGSVSSQILYHAPCSVMIFGERRPVALAAEAGAVVVGIDGSPSSHHALELAQALALPLGAKLVLVSAYDPHIPFAVMTTKGIHDMLERHGQDLLDAARATLTAPPKVTEEVVEGHARDALIAACERHAPALLVVGSRGLGGFKELLLGSTSRWVANHAPCPVVVARRSAAAA